MKRRLSLHLVLCSFAFGVYLALFAIALLFLVAGCSLAGPGFRNGQCVKFCDANGCRTWDFAKVLTTREDGVVVLQYLDSDRGDHGIGYFNPYEPKGKSLRPCNVQSPFASSIPDASQREPLP